MAKLEAIYCGRLPVEAINRTLGLELDPGVVVFSVGAQHHARKRHLQEFDDLLPHVTAVIDRPLYVRDDFRNDGKIELVSQPTGYPRWLLVAVTITVDSRGHYHVASAYPISQKKVAARRESGHLKIIK